jgi:hypothetical protein
MMQINEANEKRTLSRSAEEIEHTAMDTDFTGLFTLKHLSLRRRTDQNELPQAITIGLRHGVPLFYLVSKRSE